MKTSPNTPTSTTPQRSRLRRLPVGVRWACYTVYLGVVAFAGIELFWWLQFGSLGADSKEDPDTIWIHYYTELWDSGVINAEPSTQDETLDVLLLGGSVLDQTAGLWEAELSRQSDRPVRVFNLAMSAHSSRDSRVKYSRLKGRTFDWVVVYHGINDVPLNYAKDEDFRDDYTHVKWHSSFQRRLKDGHMKVADVTANIFTSLTVRNRPFPEMYPHGTTLRTPGPFGENIAAIVDQATGARSRVVLMTFAWHLPADYSEERFLAGDFDYADGQFRMPAEDWGKPSQIPPLVDAHNKQIERVADEHSGDGAVVFVDQAELLSDSAENFCDICHLSPDGCDRLVRHAVEAMVRRR